MIAKKAVRSMLLCMLVMLCMGTIHAEAAGTKIKGKTVKLIQTQSYKAKWKLRKGKIKWKSSNKAVATVSKKGKIKAVAAGKCKITAKNAGDTYTFTVKVKPLALDQKKLNLIRYRQYTLKLNNGKKTKLWKSSAPKVASVDSQGIVKANHPGESVITATYKGVECQTAVKVLPISVGNLQTAYIPENNQKKIVLAGSSSMDFWADAAEAFAPYEIVNTAIGGTTVVQWQNWYRSLITQYNPAAVVIYVGSNDIGNGYISGEANAAATIKLLSSVRKSLKKVPIYYVSITPCWSRKGGWPAIAVSNRLVREYCEQTANVYFMDIASKVVRTDGTPNPQLFKADALHPSEQGYQIWKKTIAKPVVKQLKREEKKIRNKKVKNKG